jgi:hypothetical protein
LFDPRTKTKAKREKKNEGAIDQTLANAVFADRLVNCPTTLIRSFRLFVFVVILLFFWIRPKMKKMKK